MSSGFSLSDYIRDINMEISEKFLPLPVINIPDTRTALRIPKYEYSFNTEKTFLEKLATISAFPNFVETERREVKSATPPTVVASKEMPSSSSENRVFHDLKVQKPSPLIQKPTIQSRTVSAQSSSYGFEEFESGKNVFDLVQLKSIDEKAELEKILCSMNNTFSLGKLNYRTLLVDPKSTSLYVGARGQLFKLWLYNVNDTSSPNLFNKRNLESKPEERDECIQMGHSTENCDSWVRETFVKSNGQLLVCSSDAVKPRLHTLDGSTLADSEYPKTIIGICSPQADLNSTAVFVEFGNPDDIPSVYSGIRTGLSLENHLIYRPPLVFNNKEQHPALRTVYTDFKWLNEPQFVGSFSVGQYVYFFFREIAVEAESCGRNIYSRVARICKNDLGGKNVLRQVWSSYVKARLNCSMPSQPQFHFNFIQSVSMAEVEAETLFYATFTSSEVHFQSSAICAFSLASINQIFDGGVFLEQPTVNSIWTPISPDRVPAHRPGTCSSNSQKLSDEELHFAKSHLLLADSIPSAGPIFTLSNEPLTTILTDVKGNDVVIFALNPYTQTLYKIIHWREQREGRHIASYQLDREEKVRKLAILPGEYIFVADDSRVSQFRVGQCPLHQLCQSCASDPYCSWSIARAECFARDSIHSTAVGWITNVQNSHRCESYVKSKTITLYPSDAVFLACPVSIRSEWLVDRKAVAEDSDHIQRTINGGLVLLNVTTEYSGTYQCLQNNVVVAEYSVIVDDKDCSRPKTVQQFHSVQREWCKKYDHYKQNLSKWKNWYNENSECPRLPNQLKVGEKESVKFI
ncbi:hypothetical protein M3Y98_00610600 [Aphelenchoides besseyi]|nr:hypothetical protein M3Y98_00610600 [Aphelenchoides besseyi]KAI6208278.1 hypothetical protein M3Y96_00098400 [Aphelenchoides besseyi]